MAYTDAQIQLQEIPIGGGQVRVVGLNPKTGQVEPVLRAFGRQDENGNADTTYYFKGDSDIPANAQEAFGVPHVADWGSGFDNFMGDIGVPAGLAAMAGAGALSGMGAFGAEAAVGAGTTAESLAAADAAGGLMTDFGTTAAYDAGIAGDLGLADGVGSSVVDGGTGADVGGSGTEIVDYGEGGVADYSPTNPPPGWQGDIPGWARLVAGIGLPTALGLYGANETGNTLHDIATTNRDDRLPFITSATGWLDDPSSYYKGKNSPGMTAVNAALRGLSVTGNPFGSPFKMEMAADAGMRSWLNAVTGVGNIGVGGETNSTNLGIAGAQADASGLNAIGYGLNNFMNPPLTLADLYRKHSSGDGVT